MQHSFQWPLCAFIAGVLAVCAQSAIAAGASARASGPASTDLAVFATNGQPDAVYARIDGGLWYSNGGLFTNIGATLGGASVQTLQAPTRDFVWAGTDTGLWVSFDRGTTWQGRNAGLACLNVTFAIVTPSDSVYAVTRCIGADLMYRSFDRGVTWQALPALPGNPQINGTNSFANQGTVVISTTTGRFRMADADSVWINDTTPTSTTIWRGVPEGSDLVTHDRTPRAGVALVRNVGPYRSEIVASGTTQPPVALQTAGLPSLTVFGSRLGRVNDDLLVPVIGNGVYRFDGTRWLRAYSNEQVPGIEYVRDVALGSATLLATSRTNGIWRSDDNGQSWQPFGVAGTTPAPALTPVTPPLQTSFTYPTGQLPAAAVTSVETSADNRSMTVVVQLDLAKITLGGQAQRFAAASGYNVYVVAAVPGERLGAPAGTRLLFQRPATGIWGSLTNPMEAFALSVALGAADARVRIEVISNTDVTGLTGTEIYVGYGTSDQEMLAAQRYRGVYIVN